MTKNPWSLGFVLFIITSLLFFGVYYFSGGVGFFDTSLKVNAFVLPLLYVGAAFLSVRSFWKAHGRISFREAFRSSFVPMFFGGFLSMAFIYLFLNFADAGARDILNYQYVERQRSELDNEYQKARQIIKNPGEKAELDKKYQERVQSFSPENVRGKDMLTLRHFSAYFGAILLFYLIISLFLAAFFRSRSAR